MRFFTFLSFMVASKAIANPLPSWDLPSVDMPIGIDPDQTNTDFFNGGGSQPPMGSPQHWISQVLADRLPKPERPAPLIPMPAPFSVCMDEAYKGFCCGDSRPATTLVRIDCQPCKPPLIDQFKILFALS